MSSLPPSEEELASLLTNVLTETPTVQLGRGIRGRSVGVESTEETYGERPVIRINRLTFGDATQEQPANEAGNTLGTSQRNLDSLYIDLTQSGMENSDGGFQMLSARSTANSTIDSDLGSTAMKYEIFRFPMTEGEMAALCKQRQSGGITACIRRGCKLNHRGPKMPFRPGTIVVARSGASIFTEPSTSHMNVSESLLAELKKTPRVLDEWNDIFCMLNNQEPSQVYTPEMLNEFWAYNEFAKDWKSSSPVRINSINEIATSIGVNASVFVKMVAQETQALTDQFTIETTAAGEEGADPTPILKTGEWSYDEAFKRLESNSLVNKTITFKIAEKLDEVANDVNEEFKILFTRIEQTEYTIGHKVTRNHLYDAPTVWGSISLLVAAMDEIQSNILAIKAKNIEYVTSMELRMQNSIEEQLQVVMESTALLISEQTNEVKAGVDEHIDKLNSTKETILLLARGAAKLKDEMQELRIAFHNIGANANATTATAATEDSSVVLSDISSIKGMIRNMGQRIDTIVDGRESKAIKFFGNTYRGHTEAESWVLENLDNDSFGLIVDAHLVFEHVYHQAFCDDGALKELNGLYKIKIDNITQGLAMSSFDHPMPKFFSISASTANKKPKVKKAESSHFDNIDSYEDWDLPIMGFRAKLKDQLEEFQETHVRMIAEAISVDDPAYRVATMSVQTSVNWIQSFITYLDETYSETFRLPSFTTARAWQLVTQIGRRVLNDVAGPRNGVKKLFRVGDNMKIAQTMFWPMIQSHEVMVRFKKANFRDDPSVSNEFMKFMATNSGSTDGLGPLLTKIAKLEADLKASQTATKGATTSATNSANKADDVKRLLTSLIQRVTILEKSK